MSERQAILCNVIRRLIEARPGEATVEVVAGLDVPGLESIGGGGARHIRHTRIGKALAAAHAGRLEADGHVLAVRVDRRTHGRTYRAVPVASVAPVEVDELDPGADLEALAAQLVEAVRAWQVEGARLRDASVVLADRVRRLKTTAPADCIAKGGRGL